MRIQKMSLSFKLSQNMDQKPTKFEFEFKQNNKYYAYGFELGNRRIRQEWLYYVTKTKQKMINLYRFSVGIKNTTVLRFAFFKFSRQEE